MLGGIFHEDGLRTKALRVKQLHSILHIRYEIQLTLTHIIICVLSYARPDLCKHKKGGKQEKQQLSL